MTKITEDQLSDAIQAMSETAGSWEERCHAIMTMLDVNFGGFSTDVPDVGSWYALYKQRTDAQIADLETEIRELRILLRRRDDD